MANSTLDRAGGSETVHSNDKMSRIKDGLSCLYVLPNVRLWINDAHIWLVRSTVYEGAVVHLEECVASIVLVTFNNLPYNRAESQTGECWHVVALFANGRMNI